MDHLRDIQIICDTFWNILKTLMWQFNFICNIILELVEWIRKKVNIILNSNMTFYIHRHYNWGWKKVRVTEYWIFPLEQCSSTWVSRNPEVPLIFNAFHENPQISNIEYLGSAKHPINVRKDPRLEKKLKNRALKCHILFEWPLNWFRFKEDVNFFLSIVVVVVLLLLIVRLKNISKMGEIIYETKL